MSRSDSPLRGKMIFAFGSPRSGTYWLQRIITAHPEVSDVASESELFSLGIAPLFERFHHGARSSTALAQMWVDRDVLLDATRDFCDRVLAPHLDPGARYLSERSPHHAQVVDLIADVYPDARLIHIIRDGRDVARSLAAREWGPGSIGAAAAIWRDAVLAARAGAPSEGYLEVRYEQLLADPGAGARALYEWLRLPIDDEVMERAVAAATRPINEDPKDARLTTNKWRDHFSAQDLADFEAEAGELLADLGYADGAGPRERAPEPVATAERPRRAVRRMLARARQQPPQPPAPTPGGALGAAQTLADTLLTRLHAGAEQGVVELLDERASLRVVSRDGERRVTGADAVAAALHADEAWQGRQLRGDQHPGTPTYSLVLSYDVPGTGVVWRVLELTVQAKRIYEITLYAPTP